MKSSSASQPLSADQKRQEIAALVGERDLLLFADAMEVPKRAELTAWFADAVLTGLEEGENTRRNPIREWLLSGVPVFLHEGAPAEASSVVEQRDDGLPIVHLYKDAQDSGVGQLASGFIRARDMEPIEASQEILPQTDSQSVEKGQKRSDFLTGSGGRRTVYNPAAETLDTANGRKAHTLRDLHVYGRMRRGRLSLNETEMAGYFSALHHSDNLSHHQHERLSEEAGGRWLWEELHSYLLAPETLKSKNPNRWFRDMCVVCGVSTTMLGDWIQSGTQANWSAMQSEREDMGFRPHNPGFQKRLRAALEYVVPTEQRAGSYSGYVVPAGSLFDLPTQLPTKVNGNDTSIVRPEAIDTMLDALLGQHHVTSASVMHALKRLSHIAHAYMGGAITREELSEQNIPQDEVGIIYQHYKGDNAVHSYVTEKNRRPDSVVTWLTTLNKEHWHIPEKQFDQDVQSLFCLPSGSLPLTVKEGDLTPHQALVYAKHHHDGSIGGFLTAYREASGRTLQQVGERIGVSKEAISQYELGKRNEESTIARALSRKPKKDVLKYRDDGTLENVWQLPEKADGKDLRADVVTYVKEFNDKHRKIPPPENHWLTLPQALEKAKETEMPGHFTRRVHGDALQGLQSVIAEQLEVYPDTAYPLITLPGGEEVLVKVGQDNEPQLLDSEMSRWHDCVLKQAHIHTMAL